MSERRRFGFRRLIRPHEVPPPPWDLDTLAAIERIGDERLAFGDADGASDAYQTLLAGRRHHLGDEHPFTLSSMERLAGARARCGDEQGARRLTEECIAIRIRVSGPDHPDTVDARRSLECLATLGYEWIGHYRAREGLRRALAADLGAEHPDTLDSAHEVAECLRDAGEIDRALALHRENHSLVRRVCGDGTDLTFRSTEGLVATLSAQGDAQAVSVSRALLVSRQDTLGANDIGTLEARALFGRALRDSGQLPAARAQQRKALAALRRRVGDPAAVMPTMALHQEMAETLEAMGDLDGARRHQEAAVEGLAAVFGRSGPPTLIASLGLADLLERAGDMPAAEAIRADADRAVRKLRGWRRWLR